MIRSTRDSSSKVRHFLTLFTLILTLASGASAQDGGQALRFDGESAYAKVNDSSLLRGAPGRDKTVEVWVKIDNVKKDRPVIQKWKDSQYKEWNLTVDGSDVNEVSVAIENDGSNYEYKAGGGVIVPNRWHHIAMTYSGNTRIVRIFIDGVEYRNGEEVPGGMPGTNAPVLIGVHAYKPDKLFSGDMDEIRIWNVAKSASQLRSAMNKRLSGDEDDLVAYWHFDDDSGTKINDETSNNHDGNLIVGPTDHPKFANSSAPVYSGDYVYVFSPGGGETLVQDDSYEIRWNASGAGSNVKIEYSPDDGDSWEVLAASTPNDGEFDWVVPNTSTAQGRMRITSTSSSSLKDISSMTFTIVADNAGEPPAGSGEKCAVVETGFRDFYYGGTDVTSMPTQEKPESRLWFHDGSWWGVLWDPLQPGFRIYRFDKTAQCWSNTGVDVDERPRSAQDVLWDGQKLYIASHAKLDHNAGFGSDEVRLYRYSYDSGNEEYDLDSGYPVSTNAEGEIESLVIDKDSNGQLWASWAYDSKVWINRSTGDDKSWGQPFVLPTQGNDPDPDDVSSIIAFDGNKIGVMWSNQVEGRTYFSVHRDNDNDTSWQPREVALTGGTRNITEDHINLATHPETGEVYAAVKTNLNLNGPDDPGIYLLRRKTNGDWTDHVVGIVSDRLTRPMVLVDSEHDSVYVFSSRYYSPKRIEMKAAHINNLNFPTGSGRTFIYSQDDDNINDVRSTKQTLNSTTGMLAIASDGDTKYYLHNYMPLGGSGGNNPPVARDDDATTSENVSAAINVLANDFDLDGSINTGSVTIHSQPDNGTVQASGTGIVTYTPPSGFSGQTSFTYSVKDNEGAQSNQATVTVTVNSAGDGQVIVFQPTDDAQVKLTDPTNNYGDKTSAKISRDTFNSYFKFNVSGLSGEVQSAKLRLRVSNENDDASDDGGSIYLVSNNFLNTSTSWDEGDLTAANAPAISGSFLDRKFSVNSDQTVDFNVSSAVTGNGVISFAITSNSTNTARYDTKEGIVSPQLIVQVSGSGGGNQPPVAEDEEVTISEDNAVDIHITQNDLDDDGLLDLTSVNITNSPDHGSVSVNDQGVAHYTPDNDFFGLDAFSYTIKDNNGAVSNTAMVSIVILPVNDKPHAANDATTTAHNTAAVINPLDNDEDIDGTLDPATVTILQGPDDGDVVVNPSSGVMTYTPDNDFSGTDAFTYAVKDDSGAVSNTATVTITVEGSSGGGGQTTTLTFTPTHDGQIKLTDPSANYGDKTTTKVESSSFRSYFKFEVSGVSGAVSQATLRLHVAGASEDGGGIYLVSNNFSSGGAWTESGLRASNAPEISGSPIANIGEVTSGETIEIDLSSVLSGNGTYSFAIKTNSSDESKYYTKEGNNPPELEVVAESDGGTTQYDLTISTQGDGSVSASPSGGTYDDGASVELTATPANGWEFSGWSGDLSGSGNPKSITMDSDKQVIATFTEIVVEQFSLSVQVNGIGSVAIDPPGGTYDTGTQVTLTANAASGWQFDGWSGDASGTNPSKTLTMNSDKDVTAIFSEESRGGGSTTLTFNPVHDGQIKLTDPSANYGDKTTTKVESSSFRSYFKFEVSGVSGSVSEATLRLRVAGSSEDGGGIYLVSNNFSSGGAWTESDLRASNAPEISGSPIANIGEVTSGETIEIDVSPVVSGNGTYSFAIKTNSSDESKYHTKEGDVPPQLKVVAGSGGGTTQYDLTVSLQGIGSVSSSPPGGAYDDGTSVELTATPANGWTFSGWSGDLSGTGNPKSITMNSDKTVTAIFVEQSGGGGGETVTFNSTHDTHVRSDHPDRTSGSESAMRIREGSPQYNSYFKFDVTGLSGPVVSARVRLFVTDDGPEGGELYSVSNLFKGSSNNWTEAELNWNNAPEISGSPLATIGEVTEDTWIEFDVTSAVSADGAYSFALTPNSSNSVYYSTKEGSNPPELVVETGSSSAVESGFASASDTTVTLLGESLQLNLLTSRGVATQGAIHIGENPAHGSAIFNPKSGLLKYTPEKGFSGKDSFTYMIENSAGALSNPAKVTVEIFPEETATADTTVAKATVTEQPLLPEAFSLSQNYPNPFNAGTNIEYALPAQSHVTLIVYNLLGQEIRTLVNEVQEAGFKKLQWLGKDDAGRDVSSGVYFIRLSAGNMKFVRKVILQK